MRSEHVEVERSREDCYRSVVVKKKGKKKQQLLLLLERACVQLLNKKRKEEKKKKQGTNAVDLRERERESEGARVRSGSLFTLVALQQQH